MLPISELFDMAAGPVRKLLNPPPQETEIQLTGDQDTKNKKTPFSMKELMVLNQRTMFLAQDQGEDDDEEQEKEVFIVTPKTIR